MTKRRALLASCALALLALLAGQTRQASAAVSSARTAESNVGARAYWTRARMRAAQPVEPALARHLQRRGGLGRGAASPSYVPPASQGGSAAAELRSGTVSSANGRILGSNRDEITDPSAAEFSAHGKVFFTIPNGTEAGDYVCSGTAVNSRNRSVVWTAGHCIFDYEASGGFSTNFIFVPGYKDGAEPYGEWPARKLATTSAWKTAGNFRYDLGAAVVRRDATGRRLQDVVGATGIGFGQPRNLQYRAYGYPAVAPPVEFNGEREFRCTSNLVENDDRPLGSGPATLGIECDMTPGSSGGGWIAGTTLLSVTSYSYSGDEALQGNLYGPYMSSKARKLYKSVRGRPGSSR